MANSKKQIRLGKRDLRVLRLARRHRIVTIDALQAVEFDGKGRDAVKSTLRRLCGKPPRYLYIRPEKLDSHRVYYRLTGRGARLIGAPREVARSLGPQAKVERLALLWFICVDRPNQRALFNPRDFPDQFQIGPNRLPRSNFFIEETSDDKTQLGYVLIDHGGHPRRIVRRSYKTLLRFLKHGWFDEFIASRSFVLTILTLSEGKKAAIQKRLKPFLRDALRIPLHSFRSSVHDFPIDLNVVVVSDLADLIPGRS